MIDVAQLSDQQLQNLMANHRRLNATGHALYGDAAREWNHRHGGGLDLQKTIAHVKAAAKERRFVSYGELAQANGMAWDKARYPMNTHLGMLLEYSHHNGWPLLCAIIVNKEHMQTGDMEPATLAGFVKAAAELGYAPTVPAEFLKEQQQLCFEWGRNEA